jgi:DNA invertase Pin-like site-specific DNA recombinase
MSPDNQERRGAVLYIRVSTEEQAKGPLNLANQEQDCRNFCDKHGYNVVGVFVDPAQSARTSNRPEFQRMVAFCKAHRKEVGIAVVQDLSRFARYSPDQGYFIAELSKRGIRTVSVREPNVDDTAAGRFAANMIGASNQYFSDSLSERMRDRTRAAVAAGRYPWPAPIGYRNVKARTGPNIIPDPQRAPLVRKAFELIATGRHRKSDVLQQITAMGLRTRRNKPLSPQTFHALLQKPVYCGWIRLSDAMDERFRGLHEALVSEQLFDEVQRVLKGKKPSIVPKRKHNPNFPLKWFVKCGNCGTPLTGGFAKGRTKRYGHYWCRKQECRLVKVSKEKLERDFLLLLYRLQPGQKTLSEFPKIAAKVWAQKQGDSQAETERLKAQLEDRKFLKSELLKAKLRGEVSQADYEEANRGYSEDVSMIQEQLAILDASRVNFDAFVRFSELMLSDIAGAWQKANADQRQRVQNLLFQGGIHYSSERGFLNRSNHSLFSMLEENTTENGMLASPTGFEPVLPP